MSKIWRSLLDLVEEYLEEVLVHIIGGFQLLGEILHLLIQVLGDTFMMEGELHNAFQPVELGRLMNQRETPTFFNLSAPSSCISVVCFHSFSSRASQFDCSSI